MGFGSILYQILDFIEDYECFVHMPHTNRKPTDDLQHKNYHKFPGFLGKITEDCLRSSPEDRPTFKELAAEPIINRLIRQLEYVEPKDLKFGLTDSEAALFLQSFISEEVDDLKDKVVEFEQVLKEKEDKLKYMEEILKKYQRKEEKNNSIITIEDSFAEESFPGDPQMNSTRTFTRRLSFFDPMILKTPLTAQFKSPMKAIKKENIGIHSTTTPQTTVTGRNPMRIKPEVLYAPEFDPNKFVIHENRKISRKVAERVVSALPDTSSSRRLKAKLISPMEGLQKIEEPQSHNHIGSKDQTYVCQKCEGSGTDDAPGELCFGPCGAFYHNQCKLLEKTEHERGYFICQSCRNHSYSCFLCKKSIVKSHEVEWCSVTDCGKVYHKPCLQSNKYSRERRNHSFKCPHHKCRTCVLKRKLENPTGLKKKTSSSEGKMFQCIRCPSAYHFNMDECIPAGCVMIAGTHIICNKHLQRKKNNVYHRPVHSNHCFECFEQGDLDSAMSCDRCPASYHGYCLPPDSAIKVACLPSHVAWFCRDCKNDVIIHYNDIVWANIGDYGWWPAEVCHPKSIPDNVAKIHPEAGEFAVRFLNTKDYYWLNQYRVFLYKPLIYNPITKRYNIKGALHKVFQHKQDLSRLISLSTTKGLDDQLKLALIEAEKLFDRRRDIILPGQKIPKNIVPNKCGPRKRTLPPAEVHIKSRAKTSNIAASLSVVIQPKKRRRIEK